MVTLLVRISDELDKKLKLFSVDKDINNKPDAIVKILEERLDG